GRLDRGGAARMRRLIRRALGGAAGARHGWPAAQRRQLGGELREIVLDAPPDRLGAVPVRKRAIAFVLDLGARVGGGIALLVGLVALGARVIAIAFRLIAIADR